MKIIAALLSVALLVDQSVAMAQMTKASAAVVSASMAMNQPEALASIANDADRTLDQVMGSGSSELADEEQSSADPAKADKWMGRLNEALSKVAHEFNKKVDHADSATLANQLGTQDQSSVKSVMKSNFFQNAKAVLPALSNEIALHGKMGTLKRLKAQLQVVKAQMVRNASAKGTDGYIVASTQEVLLTIVFSLVLIFALIGYIYFIPALLGLSVLLLLGGLVYVCFSKRHCHFGFYLN